MKNGFTEENEKSLNDLHFFWDGQFKEFYRDFGCNGDENYRVFFTSLNEYVLSHFMDISGDGEFDTVYEDFKSFEDLLNYLVDEF